MDILKILLNCHKNFKEEKFVGNHNKLFNDLSLLSLEDPDKIQKQTVNDFIVFEIIDYNVLYMSNYKEIIKFFKSSIANNLTSFLGLTNNYISYKEINEKITKDNKKGFIVEINETQYRSIKTGSIYKIQKKIKNGIVVYSFVALINFFSGKIRFKKDNNNYKKLKQSKDYKLDINVSIE